jgi:predicted nucleic-acid-binding Zn-ribbon protein
MSLKKKKFIRPQCDRCGAKIYPIVKPFRRRYPFYSGDLPLYCPKCGNAISNEKNAQVANYDNSIFCLLCIGIIIFIVVVLIVTSFIDKVILT